MTFRALSAAGGVHKPLLFPSWIAVIMRVYDDNRTTARLAVAAHHLSDHTLAENDCHVTVVQRRIQHPINGGCCIGQEHGPIGRVVAKNRAFTRRDRSTPKDEVAGALTCHLNIARSFVVRDRFTSAPR
jgi:hypothetical protein